MKLKISQFALVAGAALVAAGTPASAADLVKIGFAAPLTGTQSNYGTDMQKGVQLAIDDFNATKPVIGGKPVTFTLDSQDDQADPRTGTTVAQRLIDDGVSGIIGHFNSGTSKSRPRISTSARGAAAGLDGHLAAIHGARLQDHLPAADQRRAGGRIVGSYVVNTLHYKRVAIIDDRTAYGQGIADEFRRRRAEGRRHHRQARLHQRQGARFLGDPDQPEGHESRRGVSTAAAATRNPRR